MICPICKEQMAEVVKSNVEIYQCFNCNNEEIKEGME